MRKYFLLIILIIIIAGCGKHIAGPYQETEVRDTMNKEKTSKEALRNQETPRYPMLATPTSAGRIDIVVGAEGRYCIYNENKFGYMTEQGEEITPYIYDTAYPFHEGLACVCTGGKYGFIDRDGDTAIPFVYDNASPFMDELAYFAKGGRYGFMNKNGDPVFYLNCDTVSSFKEDLAFFSRDGKYGYIDKLGNTVIEPKYDDADYFENGLAKIRKGGKYGAITKNGEEMIPPEYNSIEFAGPFIIAGSDGGESCFDREGNTCLEEICDSITIDDGFIIFEKNGKYGFADRKGDIRMDPLYDFLWLIPEKELVIAEDHGYCGIMDFAGEIKVPFIYNQIMYDKAPDNGAFIVVLNDNYGCLNGSDFSESIPAVYDHLSYFTDNRAVVQQDNLYGVIHADGNMDIPAQYDKAQIFEDESYALKKNDITHLYNRYGDLLATGGYDYIRKTGDCYEVEKDGKSGFLDEQGGQAIPLIYDYVSDRVYGQPDAWITFSHDPSIRNSIVKTGGEGGDDIHEALLKNQITPRAGIYEAFAKYGSTKVDGIQDGYVVGRDELNTCIRSYKLYDIDESGKPILYFSAKPYMTQFYPLSYNGFYAARDNKLNELVKGSVNRGSVRGEFAHFWYDSQASSMMIGTSSLTNNQTQEGAYYEGEIYDYADGQANKACSFYCISQSARNYEKDDLLKNAAEFYDEQGNPFSETTILQADQVTEYFIDNTRVSKTEFTGILDRYQKIVP